MNKSQIKQNDDSYLLTTKEACSRYGFGASKMRQIAKEAGAEVKVGRAYRLRRSRLDEYFDSL